MPPPRTAALPDLLTVREVAELCAVRPGTVYEWVATSGFRTSSSAAPPLAQSGSVAPTWSRGSRPAVERR